MANPELTLLCSAGLTRRLLAALSTWNELALLWVVAAYFDLGIVGFKPVRVIGVTPLPILDI